VSNIAAEVTGVVPLKGDPCTCVWRQKKEDEVIFENQTFLLAFGRVQICPKDGPVIDKGWGLNLVNHKGTPDRSYVLNYCPWCGGRLHE
jgi:hypothetical protein